MHTPPDKEPLREEYQQLNADYERLEDELKDDLKLSLEQGGIRVLSIESRVKDFDSFWGKVKRKRCENPLEDIQDICGLRVICYYPSDLDPVSELIQDEFKIIEFEDKAESLKTQEFGYRSRHFIVAPMDYSLQTVAYRGLDGLKAEIQVRTIFDHAWAELSHELDYKKEERAPKRFQRPLHQLGAMLENLDDQFDKLHREKREYHRTLSEEAKRSGVFDPDQELNVDTLQALLDFRFEDKVRNPKLTSNLLSVLNSLDMSMGELLKALDSVEDIVPLVQADLSKELGSWYATQAATVLIALALANDQYWQESAPYMSREEKRRIGKWRATLSGSTAE